MYAERRKKKRYEEGEEEPFLPASWGDSYPHIYLVHAPSRGFERQAHQRPPLHSSNDQAPTWVTDQRDLVQPKIILATELGT